MGAQSLVGSANLPMFWVSEDMVSGRKFRSLKVIRGASFFAVINAPD